MNKHFSFHSPTFRQRSVYPVILLWASLFFCQSCLSSKDAGLMSEDPYAWEEVAHDKENDPPTWISYSRKVEGSKFREFKLVGEVALTPKQAIQALRERTENSKAYVDPKTGFVNVLSSKENELLVYSLYRMSLWFKDREMCERFRLTEDAQTGTMSIAWDQDWTQAPPSPKGAIRMPVARGSWNFSPLGPQKSKALYKVHAEPGGNIPAWMVNGTVGKNLPKELKQIEEIASHLP